MCVHGPGLWGVSVYALDEAGIHERKEGEGDELGDETAQENLVSQVAHLLIG
jgi:hypothetical protein